MITATLEAYKLFHNGSLSLAEVEHNGIRIDEAYLSGAIEKAGRRLKRLERRLTADPVFKTWKKAFGDRTKLGSREQLAQVLFDRLKVPYPYGRTATGKYRADEEVFGRVDLPFAREYVKYQKLIKVKSTYLEGILAEVVDGLLHPTFQLHTVVTHRSCVAEGTLVEVVRDVSLFPKGVPIEDVKVGDYAYCYDDQRRLVLRKVLWTGKTGCRRVVRIHWSARGKWGYLDVTPEHRIRLVDGRYVEARHLMKVRKGTYRYAKVHALAMGRTKDRIYRTGDREDMLDHRFIYEQLIGELPREDVVHHKDGNHYNNTPSNLQRMTKSAHASLHAPDCLTDEARRKAAIVYRRHLRQGKIIRPRGRASATWKKVGKFTLLRELVRCGGKWSRTRWGFDVVRSHAKEYGIDLRAVKERFSGEGRYISRGRLLRAAVLGRAAARVSLNVNFYQLLYLYRERGLDTTRRWANQFGAFAPNNHRIDRVEWINKTVDVYDLEVEECHNFIANEICVHNSSQDPNFQNIPVRDPVAGELIRRAFVARPGRRLVEVDLGGAEVRIAYCYHLDPTMREYLLDPTKDMHRDMAAELFVLEQADVGKTVRYTAKGKFVFAQFYGDYYLSCARNIWADIAQLGLKRERDGVGLYEHLAAKGIKALGACDPQQRPRPGTFEDHVRKVEEDFWGNRFPIYTAWKRTWWEKYLRRGWLRMKTGFVCRGVYTRNEVINFPVQGVAFHCLLLGLILLQRELKRRKMKTLIVGQIHDSVLADVPDEELDEYLALAKHILTVEVPRRWPWITIPLVIEAECSPLNGSWHDKKPVEIPA